MSRRHLVDLQVQGPNHAELRHRRQGWPGNEVGDEMSFWAVLKWGHPKMAGLPGKKPLKWMI